MFKTILVTKPDYISIALFEYIKNKMKLTDIQVGMNLRNVPIIVIDNASWSEANKCRKELQALGCEATITERRFVVTGTLKAEFAEAVSKSPTKKHMDIQIEINEEFQLLMQKDEESLMLYQDKYDLNDVTNNILDFFPDDD